ncbi:MAG: hypothetical protein PSV24_16985 [Rhodoferax sp.]|nr:hypothetical protein [Rhodoferax sp.]
MKNFSIKLMQSATLATVLLLWGCALEVENTKAAQEVARLAQPPGSVYTGWRVFQDRCAACHGAPATGTVAAPDLLPLVRNMGPRRFVGLVLMRYDWSLPAAQTPGDAAREALIEGVMQRRLGGLTMPSWQGEPSVNAHIMDLYAYLSARADGSQGPGRPSP